MQGKATLILTDKDTGRIVKQIEEHNMVTNALNSVFNLPPEMNYPTESRYNFNGFLPMYENALKGLVLFGETLPENEDDFLLGGKYTVLATAGDAYSGTDAMRGSFNENQSCEIENGYRFVWDFAPEKALGTIKALSLTNRLLGNRGNLALPGADSSYLIHPSDLSNGNGNSGVMLINGSSTFFLQKGRNTFYSYIPGSDCIIIRKYRLSDPFGLKICDKIYGVLEKETTISLGFATSSSYSAVFYNPVDSRLYAACANGYVNNYTTYFMIKYAVINPETAEKISETADWVLTGAPWYSDPKIAFYGDKIYFSVPDSKICVTTLSGAVEKTIDLSLSALYGFQTVDGKLAADCRLTSSGRRSVYIFDENKTQLMQCYNAYKPVSTDARNYIYCPASYNGYLYVMFRTDYLATINNLSSPLEKTNQHALQVRYEITNE